MYLKDANITQNIFPHALRTKFVTDMSKHGTPIEYVVSLLDHENINTTKIYFIISNKKIEHSYNPIYVLKKIVKNRHTT